MTAQQNTRKNKKMINKTQTKQEAPKMYVCYVEGK
jgi:hypothetical protein